MLGIIFLVSEVFKLLLDYYRHVENGLAKGRREARRVPVVHLTVVFPHGLSHTAALAVPTAIRPGKWLI